MDKNDPIVIALIQRSQAVQAAEEQFLAALHDLLTEEDAETEETPAAKPAAKKATPAKATPAKKAAVSKAKPEPEPVAEEDEPEETSREDELNAMRLPQLKALAKKRGFNAEQVADADKATLVEAILADEAGDEDAEDTEADETEAEDDGDEEIQLDRSDLQKKNLRELKAMAKTAGHDASDYNSLDKDSLIDLLLEEGDEDSEDEDADEDEEEGDGYTEDEIRAMSLADLKALAKEAQLTPERGWKAKDYADALVELLNEDEDDEEE